MENKFLVWNKDLERKFFTAEESAASDLRVALIGELIKAREAGIINQEQFEAMSGVDDETNDVTLDTIMKFLIPLGKTLAIVPMNSSK